MAVLEKIEEKLLKRVNELILQGEQLPHTSTDPDWFQIDTFTQWKTSSINLLSNLPIANNHFEKDFKDEVQTPMIDFRDTGLGILKSLKAELEQDCLKSPINFIQTEIFSDFLEMAEHIFEQGHKDPPVMLAGAVLEDSLRKICSKYEVVFPVDSNIASLNQLLLQKQVYNKIVFKDIDKWKAIRDFADHANFNQYDTDKVKEMLEGVRKFIGEYLG